MKLFLKLSMATAFVVALSSTSVYAMEEEYGEGTPQFTNAKQELTKSINGEINFYRPYMEKALSSLPISLQQKVTQCLSDENQRQVFSRYKKKDFLRSLPGENLRTVLAGNDLSQENWELFIKSTRKFKTLEDDLNSTIFKIKYLPFGIKESDWENFISTLQAGYYYPLKEEISPSVYSLTPLGEALLKTVKEDSPADFDVDVD